MPPPRSVRELAAVAGATTGQVRAAVVAGLVDKDILSWVDVLALRVMLPVHSLVVVGEKAPRNVTRGISAKTVLAISLVRAAATEDDLGRDAVLVVGRESARIHPSLAGAVRQDSARLYDDGVLLALPVGQWWADLRWRAEPEAEVG